MSANLSTGIVNAGPRLDRLPVSGFHFRVLGLIGGGIFLDGFELFLAGGVLGSLLKSGWSDIPSNALFISMTFAGMVIGAFSAGILGDRFGRKFSYQFNLLLFGLMSFAAAAAPSMGWLIVARFFMGIGLGAELVIGYVMLAEFVPPKQRGKWGPALGTISASALVVSSFAGFLIIPTIGWRWLFAIVGVASLVIWYLRKALPESPRWLESKGRMGEAETILSAIETEVAQGKPLPPPEIIPVAIGRHDSLAALFSKDLITRTILGSILLIGINTAVWGFNAWLPTFLIRQGMSVVSSLGYSTLIAFGGPAGTILGMWVADSWGRKSSIIIVFSLAAIVFGVGYAYAPSTVVLVIMGFLLVAATYVATTIAISVYVPELFPTEVRMRGAGLCNTAGRLATIVSPYAIAATFEAGGVSWVIAFLSCVLLIQALAVAFLGSETKLRSLEALQPDAVPAEAGSVMAGARDQSKALR